MRRRKILRNRDKQKRRKILRRRNDGIPAYSGEAYAVINQNMPYFSESDDTVESFEDYSPQYREMVLQHGTQEAFEKMRQSVIEAEAKKALEERYYSIDLT